MQDEVTNHGPADACFLISFYSRAFDSYVIQREIEPLDPLKHQFHICPLKDLLFSLVTRKENFFCFCANLNCFTLFFFDGAATRHIKCSEKVVLGSSYI